MDEEQRKRTRRATTDQLEEGRVFPVLEMIGDDDVEEADDTTTASVSDEEDFECSDDDFLDAGLDVSEDDCDDYFSQEMEEDDIDPDQLSYEELLALGEMVGVENTGLSEAEISKHVRPLTCHSTTNLLIDRSPSSRLSNLRDSLDIRCVICQVEYEQGEELVTLHCDHIYHKDCIYKWLQIKKSCPICNNEVSCLGTAQAG